MGAWAALAVTPRPCRSALSTQSQCIDESAVVTRVYWAMMAVVRRSRERTSHPVSLRCKHTPWTTTCCTLTVRQDS